MRRELVGSNQILGHWRKRTSWSRRIPRGFETLEPKFLLAGFSAAGEGAASVTSDVHTASVWPPVPKAIVNGMLTSDFPSVGLVNEGCTGTLISPRHVLTAAHCTENERNDRGTFRVGNQSVGTIDQIEHPSYNAFSLANDIAVMVLSQDFAGVEPTDILRERPILGETLTLVGYGDGGTTGRPIRDFPTKRVGHTQLEVVTSNQIRWTFDGDGESNTAPGDSGGPALVDRNGQFLVAGVTSGGDGDPWNRGGEIDHAWDTRVDVFASWIDGIVNSEPPVPEPDDHADEPRLGASKIPMYFAGGWASGALQHNGDRDAFRFRVPFDVQVTTTVVSIDGGFDTFLRLYNSSGGLIQSNDDIASGSNSNSRVSRTLQAGTYFVTVGSYSDDGLGPYSVVVRLGAEPTGDQHANTPAPAATDIDFDAKGHFAVADRLDSSADRDVFEFTIVERTTTTRLTAVATNSSLDTFLRLYDQTGEQIAFNDDGPVPTDSLIDIELGPGTYYASVESYQRSSSGTYLFSVQVDPPEVDLFSDSIKVSLDQRGRSLVAGAISPGGFTTYSFVSRFDGNMTAVTRALNAGTDTRIMVFDSDRRLLAAFDDRSLNNLDSIADFRVRENRRYFLVVASEAGTSGDYWLTLRTSPSAKQRNPDATGLESSTPRKSSTWIPIARAVSLNGRVLDDALLGIKQGRVEAPASVRSLQMPAPESKSGHERAFPGPLDFEPGLKVQSKATLLALDADVLHDTVFAGWS